MFSSKKPPFYKKSIKQPRIRFYTTYTSFFVNYILQQDFLSNKSIHYTIEFLDQIKVWCWTKLAIICPLLLLQHMAGDLVSLFCSRALQVNSPLSPKHTHTTTTTIDLCRRKIRIRSVCFITNYNCLST